MKLRETTVKGERAVFAFVAACLQRGLLVSRPVHSFDVGYDVIVHNLSSNGMWRVQIKTAYPIRDGTYWLGSLHKYKKRHPERYRYAPGLINCFVFAKPAKDGGSFSGFWIVDGKRLEQGKGAGLGLKDDAWERWELFHLEDNRR